MDPAGHVVSRPSKQLDTFFSSPVTIAVFRAEISKPKTKLWDVISAIDSHSGGGMAAGAGWLALVLACCFPPSTHLELIVPTLNVDSLFVRPPKQPTRICVALKVSGFREEIVKVSPFLVAAARL